MNMRGGPKLEKLWKSDGEKKPSTLNSKKIHAKYQGVLHLGIRYGVDTPDTGKKIIHDRGKTFYIFHIAQLSIKVLEIDFIMLIQQAE